MRALFKLRKLLSILRDRAWRRALFRWHVAAGTEHAQVLMSLGELNSIVDIGANRGQFALVARRCFARATIISFEPLSEPAEIYRKIFAGDERTFLRQVAVGRHRGAAVMHVSGRDDSSSLLPMSAEQERVFPGTRTVGTTSVVVATLSDQIGSMRLESPALLKLDVQGYELESLTGAEELLDRFQWVYAECSFRELYKGQARADQIIAWLRDRKFELRGFYNASYDARGCAVQADALFERAR